MPRKCLIFRPQNSLHFFNPLKPPSQGICRLFALIPSFAKIKARHVQAVFKEHSHNLTRDTESHDPTKLRSNMLMNIAPRADSPFANRSPEGAGSESYSTWSPEGENKNPGQNRSAISILRTTIDNFRNPTTNDQTREELFKQKMKVLTKNPALFHEFQDRLKESQDHANSKEGLSIVLHDFLDNYLRMPELRDEITEGGSTAVQRKKPTSLQRPRLRMLASYLSADTVSTVPLHQRSDSCDNTFSAAFYVDVVKSDEKSASTVSCTPSLDYLSESDSDPAGHCDDSISTASF